MFSVIFWCRVAWVTIVGALLVTTAAIPGTNNLLAFVMDLALLVLFAVANIKVYEYNRSMQEKNSEGSI